MTDQIEKAKIEAPTNFLGLGVASTFEVVETRGEKFSQIEANYKEPSPSGFSTCGACRFYLRDEESEIGKCQVVDGPIAWFGTSSLFISAESEAFNSFQAAEQAKVVARMIEGSSHMDGEEEDYSYLAQSSLAIVPQFIKETLAKVGIYGGKKRRKREKDMDTDDLEKKIERRGDKYVVLSEDGSKTLGSFDTREDAVKRLRQIEGHKNKKSMEKFVIEIPFTKADEEKRLVTGVVMEPMVVDLQGDFTDEEEIEKAAHSFMQKSRIVGKAHSTKAKAEVVESYISATDIDLGEQKVRKGSWIMTVKIHDDTLWEAVKSGEFTGFSVGGRSMKIEVEDTEEDET